MFYLLSDIHFEFFKKNQIDKIVYTMKTKLRDQNNILLLPGDICLVNNDNFEYFFNGVQPLFNKIFFILGNHEFYNSDIKSTIELVNEKINKLNAIKNNIIFLNNGFYELEEYNLLIVGTTMWSNLSHNNKDISMAKYYINDFNYINNFRPKDYQDLYEQNYKFLKETLDKYKDKKKIIMTHHMPSYDLIDKKYKGSEMNICFASSLEDLCDDSVVAWVYGHTHTPNEVKIKNTVFKCNPVGYIGENKTFKILDELNLNLTDLTQGQK